MQHGPRCDSHRPARARRGRPGTVNDVIELILAEHRQIGELLNALGHAASEPDTGTVCSLSFLWRRVSNLLDLHTEAEQEILYPVVCGAAQETIAQIQPSIADHDDIQAAAREADLEPVGSPGWRRAATAVQRMAMPHIAWEERAVLTAFARSASPQLRRHLAYQWVAFTAARAADKSG